MAMKVIEVDIATVIPYESNPRKNDAAVGPVASSIKEFGFKQPILVDDNRIVITGHTRLKAAQELGLTKVPILIAADLTEAQTKAYRIADNKVGELSKWDYSLLELELRGLVDLDFDLISTGLGKTELRNVLEAYGKTDADDIPEVEQPTVVRGDVWLLGDHRLMCGDSTKDSDVGKLLDGAFADMVFTDPPYGVSYDGGKKKRKKLPGDESAELYKPCCQMAFAYTKDDAPLYLWCMALKLDKIIPNLEAAGYDLRADIVWVKHWAQFGSWSHYKSQHETCLYCFKAGHKASWFGAKNEFTVWNVDRLKTNKLHPTQKPVALAERAIKNHDVESVLDLFGGSGSTLIACEKTNRRAYLMEIDEHYCDVIVRRWEEFTGSVAVKEAG